MLYAAVKTKSSKEATASDAAQNTANTAEQC
jgi:head-tail adaptor